MHDFAASLARSHRASDLPLWETLYREAFPTFAGMIDHRDDGEHQRAGIDRSVILTNSKQILIDEKIRGRNGITGRVYRDIALEVWSDEQRRSPGWAVKPLRADYIAYAIGPLGVGYLLPVIQMQSAFARNARAWLGCYPKIRAENAFHGQRWVTVSVGVPVGVLFRAIGGCLRVRFPPTETGSAEG